MKMFANGDKLLHKEGLAQASRQTVEHGVSSGMGLSIVIISSIVSSRMIGTAGRIGCRGLPITVTCTG